MIYRFLAAFLLIVMPVLAVQSPQQNDDAYLKKKKRIFVSAGGGGGTWSLTQMKFFDNFGNGTGGSACASNGTACTVNVSAIGANHVLVIIDYYAGSGSTLTLTATASGETFTQCSAGTSGCRLADTGGSNLGVDASYTVTTAGGATTATCTLSAAANGYHGCAAYEYAWSGSTRAFDVAGSAVDATCTSCSGKALTLTGTSDVIIQSAVPVQTISAVTGGDGYTNPQQFYGGGGFGGAINATLGTAPTWTQSPTGKVVVMAISFKGS